MMPHPERVMRTEQFHGIQMIGKIMDLGLDFLSMQEIGSVSQLFYKNHRTIYMK